MLTKLLHRDKLINYLKWNTQLGMQYINNVYIFYINYRWYEQHCYYVSSFSIICKIIRIIALFYYYNLLLQFMPHCITM